MSASVIWWSALCGNETIYDAFWNTNLTWNTQNPDLSWCFQGTVLVCIPAVFISLATIILQIIARNDGLQNLHGTKHIYRAKLFLGIAICFVLLINISKCIYDVVELGHTALALASSLTQLFSYLLATYLLSLQHKRGCHSSGVQFFFWTIQLANGIVAFRSTIIQIQKGFADDLFYIVIFYIYLTLIFLRWILVFFTGISPDKQQNGKYALNSLDNLDETTHLLGEKQKVTKRKTYSEEDIKEVRPCPEATSSYFSSLLYLWFYRVLIQGIKKDLEFDDLYDLPERDKSKSVIKAFYPKWNTKLKNYHFKKKNPPHNKGKSNSGPSLFLAIMNSLGISMLYACLCRLATIFVIFSGPLLLRALLTFIESGGHYQWQGYFIAVCMFIGSQLHSILIQRFVYHCYVFGMKLRTLVTATVYRKALRLSSAAKRQTTVGEIVNLMSVDAQKLQDIPSYTCTIWSVPITIIIATVFLWQTVGVASLAGLAVIALIVPFNGFYVANKIRKLQMKQMTFKDKRIITVNEVLAGIKVIKLYAWERFFQNKIGEHRKNETQTIEWINVLNAISAVAWNTSSYLISIAVFGTYILISPENVLNADKIFVTFSLINILNFPMGLLAMGIGLTGQAIVSLERIRKFLLLEEIDDNAVEIVPNAENAVNITNGSFSWGTEDNGILQNLNLTAKKGELVAIVGVVGSGKSSLLSALLGEMYKHSGNVTLSGSIAYVPQQAWIQHNSLKNNILFGKEENSQSYKKVIQHCALAPDLKILPDGDQTEIGEKGINLSGGQKQRVSLARAVYQNEDIYLLDDPLSAVDTHVGKHLFEQVIGKDGILKNKTRLLVTHSITYLPDVDRIIVLRKGEIQESGSYLELLNSKGAFAEFLKTYLDEKEDIEESELEVLKNVISITDNEKEGPDDRSLIASTTGSCSSISEKAISLRKRKFTKRHRNSTTATSISNRNIEKPQSEAKNLIAEETSDTGNVSVAVIKTYIKAGGLFWLSVTLIFHVLFLVFMVLTNIWLSEWSSDVPAVVNGTQIQPSNIPQRIGVYIGLIAFQVVAIQIGSIGVAMGCTAVSRVLHSRLVARVLRAPMMFFDTTPLGRIMNRCSKDMDYIDFNFPFMIRMWFFNIVPMIAIVIVISYSTPIFLAVAVPITIVYMIIQRLYIKVARQLKRIDAVKRSPVFIHFDETIVGASSIRAYRRQEYFINRCDELTDDSQRAWYLVIISYRWIGMTLETLGNLVTFCASAFAVSAGSNSSLAGLSVSYSLQMSIYLAFFVRGTSELESYLVAVERIKEYSEINTEAEWDRPDTAPAISWPSEGKVEYKNYTTRYRPGLKPVLTNVTCAINPNEKVGIVGRTGAGKSSMALSLFRIIEATAGSIHIDGIDISILGLYDLRYRLTVIPQDPVIFCDTLRSNLDPLGVHNDKTIWDSLDMAHLKSFVNTVQNGLDYQCGEGGEALSVGQRQLVCLARALLRNSKVLVLDEATSGVDLETDDLIQSTIRTAFKHCTVITIAHRLNTVMDYDRIMVMDKGKIIEFDNPSSLLKDINSVFYKMAKDANLV